MIEELHIATLSDLHFGHRRNPSWRLAKNLNEEFPDNAETAALDIIFIAGDVFDRLLTCPSDEAYEADVWIARTLRLCAKHDIVLRIVEGTDSHDYKQSERFITINNISNIGADVAYVKDLSIEYIEKFDIHVLYVPDEWDTSERTLEQVKDLIRAKGLTQVDFAIMHGQFEFQLPAFVKAQKHSSEEYLKLVKHLIFIGHVHTHSTLDRIIAQGSFDRNGHGEEEPKGHVRAIVRADGEYRVRFIENKNAMIFKTVDCTDLDLEDTMKKISEVLAVYGTDTIFIRVMGDADNPVFSNMNALVSMYPFVTWSKLVKEEESEVKEESAETEVDFQPIILNKENLPSLLLERLALHGASNGLLLSAQAMLKEVV